MKSLHHLIALALTASSLATSQDTSFPTRLLSNPVEPTAFSDDPALSTRRPFILVTPSEAVSGTDEVESATSIVVTFPETTVTLKDTLYVQTTMPTSSPSSSTSTTSATALFPQTTFPSTTSTAATSPATPSSSSPHPSHTTLTATTSSTSNPASVPTAFANAAAGLIALVGLAMAL